MQAPLREKNDIKIFILYLLRNINQPMDYTDINDIVVQDGIVNTLEFAECFAELLDCGNILEVKDQGKTYYIISDRGIEVADNLSSDLMGFIRNKSLKSALRLISFKKNGNRIETSAKCRPDGRYDLICRIFQNEAPLMEVTIMAETPQQLELMRYYFDEKPEVVYRGVLALLTGEIDYLVS